MIFDQSFAGCSAAQLAHSVLDLAVHSLLGLEVLLLLAGLDRAVWADPVLPPLPSVPQVWEVAAMGFCLESPVRRWSPIALGAIQAER